jgi:hypothetical protein
VNKVSSKATIDNFKALLKLFLLKEVQIPEMKKNKKTKIGHP